MTARKPKPKPGKPALDPRREVVAAALHLGRLTVAGGVIVVRATKQRVATLADDPILRGDLKRLFDAAHKLLTASPEQAARIRDCRHGDEQ